MALRSHRAFTLLTLLGVLSCSRPPDISDELEDYANQLNDLAAAVCVCPQDVGHTSLGECLDDRSVDTEERVCQADVATGYEEGTKAYLDCIILKLDPYIQCLEMNPGCVDGWWSDCTDAYLDDASSCPKLPGEIAVDFVECTTPLSQP